MSVLCVHMFGRLSVQCNGQAFAVCESRKVQELFCHLVLHHDHPHPREVLATLLWGDTTTAQARKSLRHTLWQLQHWLDQVAPDHANLLRTEPEWVQLAMSAHAHVWVDALAFDRAYHRVQGIAGDRLAAAEADQLQAAAELYRGDLLDGWYQDWCLFERERFQSMYLSMLEKLLLYCKAQGQYEIAMGHGERILRYDRAREYTHRQLMHLCYLAGDRARALRQFDRCVAALQEDLAVRPSQLTVQLYEQIRDEQVPADPLDAFRAVGDSVPLPQILGQLKQLWTTLAAVQEELRHHIQTVERALQRRN